MSDYVAAGFDGDAFWHKTLRMLAAEFEGDGRRQVRERNGRMFIAWHVEAFHRTKTLPDFATLIERETDRPDPPQSPDEQKQIMRRHFAMAAGK